GDRPRGTVGKVCRREARKGAPEGRLVASPAPSGHARLCGGGYGAPAGAARAVARPAHGARSAGVGGGGVHAPRRAALDRGARRRRAGRISARERSESAGAAAELGLDGGVLCGRSTLEAVARAQPPPSDRAGLARIGELRRWQIEAFGDALLAALG